MAGKYYESRCSGSKGLSNEVGIEIPICSSETIVATAIMCGAESHTETIPGESSKQIERSLKGHFRTTGSSVDLGLKRHEVLKLRGVDVP